MAERDLVVRFIGDDRQLTQAFTRQERQAKQFSGRMDKLGQTTRGFLSGFGGRTSLLFGSGAFIGSAALTAGIAKSVSAASDLNEQVSKTEQVFGDAGAAVKEWSQTTADAFGISQRQALTAASTFGNLFRVIDLAPEQAAKMSQSLVQLAADLASFNNASPEEVLTALRSGLIGEAEPLRRFGVLLSEARVQQKAMADSGKTTVKALTDQEKALARYAIILEDTTTAQGDFARTSDGLANQMRRFNANLDDLASNMGKTFLPALTEIVGGANAVFDVFSRPAPPQLDLSDVIDNLTRFKKARDDLAEFAGEDDFRVQALTNALEQLEAAAEGVSQVYSSRLSPALRETTTDARGYETSLSDAASRSVELIRVTGLLGSAMADAGSRMQAAGEDAQSLADATARAAATAEKRFTTSIKGLQLKLEKAELTPGLQDDLAVLNEILARINRRIRAEGRTFELEQERVRVLQQIKSVQEQIAAGEAAAASDAAAASRARAQADKDEEERRRRAASAAAQRRRDRIAGDQFEALGLTRTGAARGPSTKNLRRRAERLEDQIKGTALDTTSTRNKLNRIAKVLSGAYGKVGKDVRSAILAMLNDITNALKDGAKQIDAAAGPLTKTTSLNSRKITEGLGLSQEEIRALRGRLSNFNSAGIGLAGARTGTTGSFSGPGPVEVESHITINIDGKKIASVVTKQQQKDSRRNPRQKRGPNRRGNDA